MKFTVLGGGSWGSALAIHLAYNQHQVNVWEYFAEQAKEMQTKRQCPLLPEIELPKEIKISHRMQDVFSGHDYVFLVVPSDKAEVTIKKASDMIGDRPVVICTKGFTDKQELLSEMIARYTQSPVYCLYGPTHAEEVGKRMFSGILLAGPDDEARQNLHQALNSQWLKVDTSDDIVGAQISAALKNILAIFVGMLDGMQLGDNAKAFIMTKGNHEIMTLGQKLGAKPQTALSLAGIGDVIVTCSSKHSRNRHVGEQLGKGKKLDQILEEMNMVAEGVNAAKNAQRLIEKFGLDAPILSGMYKILYKNEDPHNILETL